MQGTTSSKKKKQAKLKRVMATVKRQAKKDAANPHDSFAAVQLLNDPQVLPQFVHEHTELLLSVAITTNAILLRPHEYGCVHFTGKYASLINVLCFGL